MTQKRVIKSQGKKTKKKEPKRTTKTTRKQDPNLCAAYKRFTLDLKTHRD